MISIETARSGHPIIRKDGRLLGSSFDPIKEAASWAGKIAPGVTPGTSVFVLGLGAGYHVEALRDACPNATVIVIDADPELGREALKLCPRLKSGDLVIEPDVDRLIEHGRFLDGICGQYMVVKHGPSCQIEPEYFARAERLLIARDRRSLLLQLKARPEFNGLFDMKALDRLGDETISIKTLQKAFAEQVPMSTERRIWKILEELIV